MYFLNRSITSHVNPDVRLGSWFQAEPFGSATFRIVTFLLFSKLLLPTILPIPQTFLLCLLFFLFYVRRMIGFQNLFPLSLFLFGLWHRFHVVAFPMSILSQGCSLTITSGRFNYAKISTPTAVNTPLALLFISGTARTSNASHCRGSQNVLI